MPTAKWHIKIYNIFKMYVWYMIRVVTVYHSTCTIQCVKKSMNAFINKERCINDDWKETSSSNLAVQKRELNNRCTVVYWGCDHGWILENIEENQKHCEIQRKTIAWKEKSTQASQLRKANCPLYWDENESIIRDTGKANWEPS